MIVGLDIHKEMSYATVIDNSGKVTERVKGPSSYDGIRALLDRVPGGSEVALEATSSALSIYSQLKSDKADSEVLARLLLMDWPPESYVPDERIQELRELTRTRHSFKSMKTRCKNSIHAELIRNRIVIEKPFTVAGMRELDRLGNWKIDLFQKEMGHIHRTIGGLDSKIEKEAQSIEQCRLLMSIPGIGAYSAVLIYSPICDNCAIKGFR